MTGTADRTIPKQTNSGIQPDWTRTNFSTWVGVPISEDIEVFGFVMACSIVRVAQRESGIAAFR
jgi:hypothetical protein